MGVYTAICMLVGAILSAGAGYIDMSIATLANTRTCEASKDGLNAGLNVVFESGTIIGLHSSLMSLNLNPRTRSLNTPTSI